MNKFASGAVILALSVGLVTAVLASRQWGDNGVFVASNQSLIYPILCKLGETDLATAYSCLDDNGVCRAAIQGLDIDGQKFFEDGPIFLSFPDLWVIDDGVIVEPDLNGGVFVIWQVLTETAGELDVYAQRLDSRLNPIWAEGGVLLYRTNAEIVSKSQSYIYSHYYGVLAVDDGGLILVDRRAAEVNRPSLYDHLFFIRRFDANGRSTGSWPLFEITGNVQFYPDPGRGLWCCGRSGRGRDDTLQVNMIRSDGALYFEDTLFPELPENSEPDDLAPDNLGGFYLAVYQYSQGERCRAGVQRYNANGEPVWDGDDIWFESVNVGHRNLIPIASENGSRLMCFVYIDVGQSGNDTELHWFAPRDDHLEPLWNSPMFFDHQLVEPFFYMGDGDLLLDVRPYEWNGEEGEWQIDRAEANVISINGRLLWDEGAVPIALDARAVPITFESFYITTQIMTWNYQNEVLVDRLDQWHQSEWEEPSMICSLPQFGKVSRLNTLRDEVIRLIGVTDEWPGPIEATNNYQLLNPDGSLQLPINGEEFCRPEGKRRSTVSAGSMIALNYEGWPIDRDYREVTVFNDRNEIQPDEPLWFPDLARDETLREICGDSIGGAFFMLFEGLDENERYDIVRVNAEGVWDGVVLRPFVDWIRGAPVLTSDGSGSAWVTGWTEEEGLIQKISADNELVWDEPRRWDCPWLSRSFWLPATDGGLYLIRKIYTDEQDTVNAMIWSFDSEARLRWEAPASAFTPHLDFPDPHIFVAAAVKSEGGVWILAWERFNPPPDEKRIRLQSLSADGERLWGDLGIELPLHRTDPKPRLLDDGAGGVWVFMPVIECEPEGLRALHFNRAGQLIDDLAEPDPNGTAVIRRAVDGMSAGEIQECWRYEDGDAGIIFKYGETWRAQRISDRPSDVNGGREPACTHEFAISAIYPSPSNDRVTVNYRLTQLGSIELSLLDLTGREVGIFYSGVKSPGDHQASLAMDGLASGSYFVQLKAEGAALRKIMIEIK